MNIALVENQLHGFLEAISGYYHFGLPVAKRNLNTNHRSVLTIGVWFIFSMSDQANVPV
jgi:hypothetical protein